MLITKDSPDAAQYTIHDCVGHLIPFVSSFDTETQEIEMAIRVPPKPLEEDEVNEKLKEWDVKSEEDSKEESAAQVISKPSNEFLMQTTDEENKVGAVFVKFTLPGSYALKDGKQIQ